MSPQATENNGTVTLTVRGRHESMSVDDAEEFLDELERAIEAAQEKD